MKLTNETAIEWWMEYLDGELPAERKLLLDKYLDQHPELRRELQESATTWAELEHIEAPAPSSNMEMRFLAMLDGYSSAAEKKSSLSGLFSHWMSTHWQASLVSLCVGLLIGLFLLPRDNDEVRELSAEVSQMKKMLVLSMIEKPQAQDRIRAVNMVNELENKDDRVIESLITILNNDKSINVRLATLEALLAYGSQPVVREALVRSIALQDSPLLQVALADAMVLLQEKEAIDAFQEVLQAEHVDENVRFKLKSTIETLKEI